jgi:hypothetical protein
MFKKIVKTVAKKGKALKIEKRTLNFISFDSILRENPRLLFIMCHG